MTDNQPTTDYAELKQMVLDMHKRKSSYTVGFSDWEKDFLVSMKEHVDALKPLTPNMVDKINKMWEKM